MTKLRTIKEKMELKRIVINSIGNTGELRKLAVHADGTWQIHSSSTCMEYSRDVVFFGRIDSILEHITTESKTEMLKELTALFRKWEGKYTR